MKLIVQWRGDLQKFTGTFPDGCGGVINADLGTGAYELWFKIGAFAATWGRGTTFDEVTVVKPEAVEYDPGVPARPEPKSKPVARRRTTSQIPPAEAPRETGSDPQV
jgi:hypothetical protein